MQTDLRESVLRLMEQRGLTISELARMAGVARPNLSNWLAGKRSIMLPGAEAVMAALGITLNVPKK